MPSGTAKIGDVEYRVKMNNSPALLDTLNNLPIKSENGVVTYVRDVAHVRDGYAVQTNIVRHNGSRGALLTVLKTGGASTLDIVRRLKEIKDSGKDPMDLVSLPSDGPLPDEGAYREKST